MELGAGGAMKEKLTCIFCGQPEAYVYELVGAYADDERGTFKIGCANCGLSFATEAEAREGWEKILAIITEYKSVVPFLAVHGWYEMKDVPLEKGDSDE